ncbi:hypothetical protein D3Z52_20000 [Clostridiaceae bacterium]|nr:hypothetical protein [Clostridiaceae bacterium]
MNLKKVLCFMLCCGLTLTLLTGCSGNGANPTTAPSADGVNQADEGNSNALTDLYDTISADIIYVAVSDLPEIKANQDYTVGVAMTDVSTGWFKALYDHVNEVLSQAGVTVNLVQCNDDAAMQVDQINTFIAQNVDAIIINPANPQETVTSALDDCAAAGIPVVAVDVPPEEGSAYMTACVTDAYSLGKMVGIELAKRLLEMYPDLDKIPYGMIGGTDGNSIAASRNEGARDGIAEVDTEGKIEERTFLYAGAYSEESGLTTAQNMIAANPDLKCIIGTCDAHIVGATSAAEQLGVEENLIMGAVDGSKSAYEIMRDDGPIVALGLNSPYEVGEAAVRVLLAYLNDGTIPDSKTLRLQPTLVTPENVEQYYDPDSAF